MRASCIALSGGITELYFKIGRGRKAAAAGVVRVIVALGRNTEAARFARSPAATLALAYPSRGVPSPRG